ncbi:MAG: radical SAM protein [Clostridia bacterium]|nr:radical SAM protein [Clostridia bacterium]
MIAKRNIIPIFVPHMGCPNNCVFCNQRRITGSLLPPTAQLVGKTVIEALNLIPEGKPVQVAFYGGSFTAIDENLQRSLLGAVQPFLRDGRVDCLRVSTRPDAIDSQTLDLLEQYGVRTIELGAQSMCDEVLAASGRGHTAAQTGNAAKLIKIRGFELILQMMTGLPGDTKERSIETAQKIIALAPDGVRIYPSVIIENTPMEDMWREGKYCEHTVDEAVDWCARIVPMFEAAGITIIRLGLNPTEELSCGSAVAGAYHPALGELVYSRVILSRACSLLSKGHCGKDVVLGVNASDISIMTGQHRCNIFALTGRFGLNSVKVRACDIEKGRVVLLT